MGESSEQRYQRVDTARLASAGSGEALTSAGEDGASAPPPDLSVRWWIIPLSALLCVGQAVGTIMATNLADEHLTPTLISVVAFGALFLLVLAVVPAWRALYRAIEPIARTRLLRPMNRAEVMCVFTAMLVTSGISTFGLSEQLVPMVATPWNEEWNTAQRGWSDEVLPHLNPALFIAAPEDAPPERRAEALEHIRSFRQGLQPTDAEGEVMSVPPQDAPLLGDGGKLEYWLALFQQVPWGAWAGPLAGWLIFIGACYAMFYCLTYVVLGYWVRREKLIFPLAQLPEQLLPDENRHRLLPAVLRSSGFWLAFAIVFAIWSWNGAVAAEWIPGLGRINLGMSRAAFAGIAEGTLLEGLTGGHHEMRLLIIFTTIGLAFLLPTEISFSLWFYFLVGKAMILLLVWAGHGQTGDDFPSDHFVENNTVTAQGGGALLMFAAISLGRAVMDLFRLGRGKTLREKAMLGLPVLGLGIALGVIFAWFTWNNLPILWALIVTAALLLITMGLMRVVAEGGIYWFQLHTSPMHLYQAFGLGHVFKPAAAMVPLIPLYSVLFFDLKTFLAPNLTNAARMHEGVGGSRLRFHLNIILCLIVSVAVAIIFTIFLAHLLGAQQMQSWFYNSGPPWIIDHARDAVAGEPGADLQNAGSYLFGAGWVMFSMFIRGVLFWFPHPIGYVMLVNPLMASMWFGFFLGWLAKKFVVKYGGKQTFDHTRPIFLGLIMGELIAIAVWAVLGITYGFEPDVTLNRTSR